MEMFLVGGFVRDQLMGVQSKDVDFCVVVPDAPSVEAAFVAMRDHLLSEGFTVHIEKPEFLTIRAGVPKGHPLREMAKDADFVVAREDGAYSDGRRPDEVRPGSLHSDLSRRDFTVNAIARAVDGRIIDPFGGRADIEFRRLRFVGDPVKRITEDGLRVLRGFRFMVTKGLRPTPETAEAMTRPLAVEMLAKVSTERIRDELERMFVADTLATLDILSHTMPVEMRDVVFSGGLRLSATMRS